MSKYAIVTNDLQFAAANKHEQRKQAVGTFLPIQVKLLEELRKMDVPVIHLQLIVSDDDPRSQGIPDDQKFTEGSKGAELLEEVFEEGDIVIKKPKDSGFFETTLDETLKELGVEILIISGMQTQICVQTTAADAHFRGYKILIPNDAVVSSRAEDTKRSLEWLADYCAKVIPSDEIIKIIKKDLKGE